MQAKNYYGQNGPYLKEHKDYFSEKRLKEDVDFMIKALKLKKTDKILDIACGHGRHTVELAKRGFDIEGIDFSAHLLSIARKTSKKANLDINFYKQNIHNIKLNKKYTKAFLFFSDFGIFDAQKAIKSIAKLLKKDATFLLDTDNVFRLVKYLDKHPKSPFKFDFINMELQEKGHKEKSKYYTVPQLREVFIKAKLFPYEYYGNYNFEEIDKDSKRTIILSRKK